MTAGMSDARLIIILMSTGGEPRKIDAASAPGTCPIIGHRSIAKPRIHHVSFFSQRLRCLLKDAYKKHACTVRYFYRLFASVHSHREAAGVEAHVSICNLSKPALKNN